MSGEERLNVTHTLSATPEAPHARLMASSGGQGKAQGQFGDASVLSAVTPIDVGTARDLTCNFFINEHFV